MSEDEKKEDLKKKKKKLSEVELLREENATLLEEVAKWKNEFYKVYADMENTKKQNDKDREYFIKYRASSFIDKLLPALDAFSVVLRNEPEDPLLRNYLQGFKYIYTQLSEALTSEGVKIIIPQVGDEFDPKTMHALETKYSEEYEPNKILTVHYYTIMHHDRIHRPATVVVSSKEKVEETEPSEPLMS